MKVSKSFLEALFEFLQEDALKAKKDMEDKKGTKESRFYVGRLDGHREIFNVLFAKMKEFNISPKDFEIYIDPEKELR